jgi:hypothetical protein
MLTRQKLGYAPGTMDAVFLGQDFAALDAELHSEQAKYDDLLLASSEIEAEARRLGLPELLVKALIQRSNILLADQRYLEAIAALTAADQALGNLRQYDLKVSIYAGLAEAQARRQDWQAVSDTCEKGIALVETHRYKVSGQYLQSSYLRSRIGLYARGAQAAYQLKEHQLALQRAELSKCRSVLRYRPSSAAPMEKEHRIQQEFRQVCQQVNAARAAGNNQALDALLTKRRTLWDLLLIQRAQARTDYSFPEFDLAALQAALDDDEAVLYYYWLDSHTLLAA